MEKTLLEKVKEHLAMVTPEQFEKNWKEIEELGFKEDYLDDYLIKEVITQQYQLLLTIDEFIDISHPIRNSNSYQFLKSVIIGNND